MDANSVNCCPADSWPTVGGFSGSTAFAVVGPRSEWQRGFGGSDARVLDFKVGVEAQRLSRCQ